MCLKHIAAGLTESPVSGSVAQILESVHTALRQLDDGPEEGDAAGKKLAGVLLQIAALLLEVPVLVCDQLHAVIVKLEEYVRRSKQECIPLVPPLLTAAFREHHEVQLLDELLQKLTTALGLIDEDESSAEGEPSDFPSIDARSGHVVLAHICTHLRVRARALEHVLARARDLYSALSSATHQQHQRIDKELKQLYEGIIIQLCQLTRCVSSAARLRWGGAGGGAAGEGPPGACVRLYALLAALARQLPPHMAPALRLERLLKVCGRRLSAVCDALITYAEASGGRSTRLVPRLVLEAESFSRHVIVLEKKAKLNYQQFLSLGTARDFRIKAPVLQEVLGVIEQRDERDDDPNITDAETDILSPVASERDDSEDEGTSKRRKIQ